MSSQGELSGYVHGLGISLLTKQSQPSRATIIAQLKKEFQERSKAGSYTLPKKRYNIPLA